VFQLLIYAPGAASEVSDRGYNFAIRVYGAWLIIRGQRPRLQLFQSGLQRLVDLPRSKTAATGPLLSSPDLKLNLLIFSLSEYLNGCGIRMRKADAGYKIQDAGGRSERLGEAHPASCILHLSFGNW